MKNDPLCASFSTLAARALWGPGQLWECYGENAARLGQREKYCRRVQYSHLRTAERLQLTKNAGFVSRRFHLRALMSTYVDKGTRLFSSRSFRRKNLGVTSEHSHEAMLITCPALGAVEKLLEMAISQHAVAGGDE